MASSEGKSAHKGENVLVLHQLKRGYYSPGASPFPIKLETYLRANKISYESDFDHPLGPRQKTPWMTYNGQVISDSQLCIEFLNDKLNIDMNAHLDKEQKAIAKSFRHFFEDHVYWLLMCFRLFFEDAKKMSQITPMHLGLTGKIFSLWGRRHAEKQCHAQGLARFTPEEVLKMVDDALRAFSDFLGSKPYLMGERICEEDCSIFGLLVQFLYNVAEKKILEMLLNDCPNIKEYCERIKSEYWPDWNECCAPLKSE